MYSENRELNNKNLYFQYFCKIEAINEIPLRNDTKHKRIIIKILWNETTPNSINMISRLNNNETIKIVHNMPWYWKVVATTPQK
jgi:hypothetical protein